MCGYIQGYIKNHAYTGGFIVSRAQFLNYVQFKFMHLLQMICFPGTRLTNDRWRKTDSADTRMPYSGCILELREKSASHCQPASIKLSSRNFPHFRMKQITWLGYFQTIYQHSSSCVIISQFFCFLFLGKKKHWQLTITNLSMFMYKLIQFLVLNKYQFYHKPLLIVQKTTKLV